MLWALDENLWLMQQHGCTSTYTDTTFLVCLQLENKNKVCKGFPQTDDEYPSNSTWCSEWCKNLGILQQKIKQGQSIQQVIQWTNWWGDIATVEFRVHRSPSAEALTPLREPDAPAHLHREIRQNLAPVLPV